MVPNQAKRTPHFIHWSRSLITWSVSGQIVPGSGRVWPPQQTIIWGSHANPVVLCQDQPALVQSASGPGGAFGTHSLHIQPSICPDNHRVQPENISMGGWLSNLETGVCQGINKCRRRQSWALLSLKRCTIKERHFFPWSVILPQYMAPLIKTQNCNTAVVSLWQDHGWLLVPNNLIT